MPAWNDYKNSARERGALAFELYVAVSMPIAPPEEMVKVLPEHLEYIRAREADGSLFLAGPMSDLTGEQMQGVGLIIYRAHSMEEAQALAAGDPMHAKNIREFTLRKWMVNEGAPSFAMALSAREVFLN
ncbi:YciI family protein [Alphaproteobacteria bacterium]|nr:YciI family protein [Alphaproteobacteria bacterium]